MDVVNAIAWVAGNIVVLVIAISASAFVLLYPLLFEFEKTTAGLLIWRAVLSLALLGGLVCLGIFVDGRVPWWQYPGDVVGWRPLLRLAVYGFIAYTFASLVALLVIRRWWPDKVKTAPKEWVENVKPRQLRHKDL